MGADLSVPPGSRSKASWLIYGFAFQTSAGILKYMYVPTKLHVWWLLRRNDHSQNSTMNLFSKGFRKRVDRDQSRSHFSILPKRFLSNFALDRCIMYKILARKSRENFPRKMKKWVYCWCEKFSPKRLSDPLSRKTPILAKSARRIEFSPLSR